MTHALDVKGLERNAGEDLSDERTEREGRGEADRRDGGSVMWKCDKCGHETPTGVEHFCDARPLPDFPAGAPGPWSEALAVLECQRLAGDIFGLLVGEYDARRFVQVFLPRVVHAPARPAAAGLTEDDIEECATIGVRGLYAAKGLRPEDEDEFLDQRTEKIIPFIRESTRRAVVHAESILSSRATGAEVEIPEPTEEEYDAIRDAVFAEWDEDDADGDKFDRLLVKATIAYARRHDTIRRGGGE